MTRIRLFLCIIAISMPSLAAAQQAMKFEESAAMLAASCGKDIDDNCRGVNLDPTRLKDCLLRNQDVVSAQCKADYPKAFSAVQQRAAARAGVFKICARDAAKLCGGAHSAETLQCLASAKRGVSIQCTKTIADAGYQ